MFLFGESDLGVSLHETSVTEVKRQFHSRKAIKL